MQDQTILVTGGMGYLGGRLIPRLLEGGYRMRAMEPSPEYIFCRGWGGHPSLMVIAGSALDRLPVMIPPR